MKDKRAEYTISVKNRTLDKILAIADKKNLLMFILEDLRGVEKLYGLLFHFTTSDESTFGDEDRDLMLNSHFLIIGDLMDHEEEFINQAVENIIDCFYSFDQLKDGFLISHHFDEMERYMDSRQNIIKRNLN